MSKDPLKSLWQAQEVAPVQFSPEELGKKSRSLRWRVSARNALEYLACLLVIAGFWNYLREFPQPLLRLGSALIILGTLYVAWQIHRRASSMPASPGLPGLDYHRQQLQRQRDALRSVWAWYIGPLVPGMVVFRWGVETQLDASAPFARGLYANLAIAAVMVIVVLINLYTARKLQRQIDQLPSKSQ